MEIAKHRIFTRCENGFILFVCHSKFKIIISKTTVQCASKNKYLFNSVNINIYLFNSVNINIYLIVICRIITIIIKKTEVLAQVGKTMLFINCFATPHAPVPRKIEKQTQGSNQRRV